MKKKSLIILGILGISILIAGGIIIMRNENIKIRDIFNPNQEGIVSSSSFDPNNTLNISYEFVDNGDVTHIWNDVDDYYFNTSSGIQFTNHYQDYWTTNVFCIGYYSGEEWNKIYCADDLSNFNRNIHTDNETYVNATLWKDVSYGAYDLRLAVNYYLETYDQNLTVTIYGKNIGIDIPFDLGFAWIVKNVSIPGLGEDFIDINGTSYQLNQSGDIVFSNMDEGYYKIHDVTKFLRLDWNNNLDYKVKLHGDGNQENFYTALLINASRFNAGDEKSTQLYWIDADTTVRSPTSGQVDLRVLDGPYWYDTTNGVIISSFITDDPERYFTSDGGATWSASYIETDNYMVNGASWYDWETPGITDSLIHFAWLEGSGNLFNYKSINASTGVQGTEYIINDTLTVSTSPVNNRVGITKTLSGNLIACTSTQSEHFCMKSTDDGVTWSEISSIFESATEEDWILLYPANTADDNDASGIFWDRSANAISIKMYDDSADSWTETAIASSMVDEANYMAMDGAVRHSDGHIMFGAWDDCDSLGADILTWDINPNSIGSPSVTQKTDVIGFFGASEACQVGMFINQQTDDIWLTGILGGTWLSSTDVVYWNSTDGMSNWNGGTSGYTYSETTDDIRIMHTGRTVGNNGGRFQPSFYNDDTTSIYVNLVYDTEISAYTPPAGGDCWEDTSWGRFQPSGCVYNITSGSVVLE